MKNSWIIIPATLSFILLLEAGGHDNHLIPLIKQDNVDGLFDYLHANNLSVDTLIIQFDRHNKDSIGWPLISAACYAGSVNCVQGLATAGAELNKIYFHKRCPLELALRSVQRNHHISHMIQILITHGANANYIDYQKFSPLDLAVSLPHTYEADGTNSRDNLVRLLLDNGALFNIRPIAPDNTFRWGEFAEDIRGRLLQRLEPQMASSGQSQPMENHTHPLTSEELRRKRLAAFGAQSNQPAGLATLHQVPLNNLQSLSSKQPVQQQQSSAKKLTPQQTIPSSFITKKIVFIAFGLAASCWISWKWAKNYFSKKKKQSPKQSTNLTPQK